MTENGDKKEFGLPGVCGIALFTVLFCVLFPYLGFVSLAAVTAMTGVRTRYRKNHHKSRKRGADTLHKRFLS